ncbi:MAG: nuclear transport factor 2 family protein [Sphingobium sp.]|nr:nuclear transport factor 2 family protein [Sphingobium sp.]
MSEAGSLRPWFEAYVDAFNRDDFEGFGAYYAKDVVFQGQAAQLVGREEVLAFYRFVKSKIDETLELLSFVGSRDLGRIAVEMRTLLVAREDWLDMPTGAMRAGDRRESVNFILYDIVDDRFTRVRSARFSSPGAGRPA